MRASDQVPFGEKELNEEEYISNLKDKLIEETKELAQSKNKENVIEELADVQEVIEALKSTLKIKDKEVEEKRKKKNDKNGSFSKKTYVDYLGLADNDPWLDYYLKNSDKYPEIKSVCKYRDSKK